MFFVIALLFLSIDISAASASMITSDSFNGNPDDTVPQYNSTNYYLPSGYYTDNNANLIVVAGGGLKLSPESTINAGGFNTDMKQFTSPKYYCESISFTRDPNDNQVFPELGLHNQNRTYGPITEGTGFASEFDFRFDTGLINLELYRFDLGTDLVPYQSFTFDNTINNHTIKLCNDHGIVTNYVDGIAKQTVTYDGVAGGDPTATFNYAPSSLITHFELESLNSSPSANANGPYSTSEGNNITLDGAGTDIEDDPLTYSWDLDNNGSFETSGQHPVYTAVDGDSTKKISLKVCDNNNACDTTNTTIAINNVSPAVGSITVTPDPAHINTVTTVNASFTDAGVLDTHTANWNWGDGNITTGTVTESNGSGTVSDSHTYTSFGTYTITLTVTDNDIASGQNSAPVTVVKQITALNPAQIWISKNLADAAAKFDLLAQVYKDTTLVSSGQVNSVTAGSGGFNNATLESIPFNSFSPIDFPVGSTLKVVVSVRNACVGSLRNSATANIWFNDSSANSKFGATIGNTASDYFLRDAFALSTTVGSGPRQLIAIAAGAKCSAFKPFGTWSITP